MSIATNLYRNVLDQDTVNKIKRLKDIALNHLCDIETTQDNEFIEFCDGSILGVTGADEYFTMPHRRMLGIFIK